MGSVCGQRRSIRWVSFCPQYYGWDIWWICSLLALLLWDLPCCPSSIKLFNQLWRSHRGCLTCFVLALTLLNLLEDTENQCHQKPGQFPWERKCLSLIRRVLAISTWPSTSPQEPTWLGGKPYSSKQYRICLASSTLRTSSLGTMKENGSGSKPLSSLPQQRGASYNPALRYRVLVSCCHVFSLT